MSISVSQWVWEHSESSHASRLVLLAIADLIREDRIADGAWPSVEWLMRRTRLKERAVRLAIADLEKLGELRVARQAGPKGSNLYYIDIKTPAKSAPLQNMHPAESAPPEGDTAEASPQVDGQEGAESAPPVQEMHPAKFAGGVQNLPDEGAESAPEPVIEPEDLKPSRTPRDLNADREDVTELCSRLADRIEANGCKRPTITKQWRDAARLMIDRDGRSMDQIRKAIDWSTADEFWRGNILSMPKLREQYEKLRLAAQRQRGGNGRVHPQPSASRRSPSDEFMARR